MLYQLSYAGPIPHYLRGTFKPQRGQRQGRARRGGGGAKMGSKAVLIIDAFALGGVDFVFVLPIERTRFLRARVKIGAGSGVDCLDTRIIAQFHLIGLIVEVAICR